VLAGGLLLGGLSAGETRGQTAASPADYSRYYTIEEVPTPSGLDAQVGGLAFTPGGKLAACFHRGEVLLLDLATGRWSPFAEGLQEPLGLVALSDAELLVMQRTELTRLIDEDGDGRADVYRVFFDDFGVTGNYHEYAFGPVRDPDGNCYISLNLASNLASIFEEVRGAFHPVGLPRERFYDANWKAVRDQAGRMFARVPWRGWVLKIAPDGRMTPVACGFRSPNGLGFDLDGRLYVTDNQGDWVGTSKCFHVEPGKFYGHPASLLWREGWTRDPLTIPVAELDAMRTEAAFLFPHGEVANSPTQPVCDTTDGRFGPFAGQMVVGEMNFPRLLRLMPDWVGGEMQGAVVTFIEGAGLRIGNNRLAFAPDGSLFVGQTHLGWAGAQGIQRIRWTGQRPFDVRAARLTPTGFDLAFTRPVDPAAVTPTNYTVKAWRYLYHAAYGSPKVDEAPLTVSAARLGADGRTVSLELTPLEAGKLYEIRLDHQVSRDGVPLLNARLHYHAKRLATAH
jgi:glucose/arabinose dehydrogenase